MVCQALRLHARCLLVEFQNRLVTVAQLAEHRVVVPKVAGSSPVGHPSCANLAFATHCKEAPVFREYGLAPLAHECGVVTGAVMRLL
jgi:hypothetical protein